MSTHAIFKALIFMCTGFNIRIITGGQEKRFNFILSSKTKLILNAATLSLIGMPFIRGFYSKDIILERAITTEINILNIIMFISSCVITSFYSLLIIKNLTSGKLVVQPQKENLRLVKIEKAIIIIISLILLSGVVIIQEINNQIIKSTFFCKKIGILFIISASLLKLEVKKKIKKLTQVY